MADGECRKCRKAALILGRLENGRQGSWGRDKITFASVQEETGPHDRDERSECSQSKTKILCGDAEWEKGEEKDFKKGKFKNMGEQKKRREGKKTGVGVKEGGGNIPRPNGELWLRGRRPQKKKLTVRGGKKLSFIYRGGEKRNRCCRERVAVRKKSRSGSKTQRSNFEI